MEKKPDIKIFVSHRIDLDSETIDNPLYVNVRCGAVFDKRENVDMLGDDTGDNISEKKPYFSELTVMYWAWRNVKADYYGLCHYRRYILFSDIHYPEDEYSNVTDNYICKNSIQKYSLNNESLIRSIVTKYDCVVTTPFCVGNVGCKNLMEQYALQPFLQKRDLDILINVIDDMSPEYSVSARKYLNGNKLIPCLMFVMKKCYFFEFAEWTFKIIDELEKRVNVERYSEEGIRTIAHLAERLLGIFLSGKNNLNIVYMQRVLFWCPEKEEVLYPIGKKYIPVVFSSSDYYVPFLYVTIYSMLENTSSENVYEIIILNTNISRLNKEKINSLERIFCGIKIRFYNILRLLGKYSFRANNHVTVETFYRLFIPKIFCNYKKVVFLDSDLIIKEDIKSLYDLSDDTHVITATRDFDYESQYYAMPQVKKYTNDVLGITDVERYFQAGVLVFNVEQYNKKYKYQDMLKYACSREFMYVDQDVMNSFLSKDILYISNVWNVMTDCAGERLNNIKQYASKNSYEYYIRARQNPSIIHYAGWAKPWNRPEDDFANDFWEIARKTIFYEVILSRMSENMARNVVKYNKNIKHVILRKIVSLLIPKKKEKKMLLKSHLNIIVSLFAPIGTKRRAFLKRQYTLLRGR